MYDIDLVLSNQNSEQSVPINYVLRQTLNMKILNMTAYY